MVHCVYINTISNLMCIHNDIRIQKSEDQIFIMNAQDTNIINQCFFVNVGRPCLRWRPVNTARKNG